jgi:hypothetical protein
MSAAQPSFATIRLVTRLAAPCTLDAALATRRHHDFLDALILLAVVQANIAPLMRDPALQRAYAAYEEPPPDDLRRPVSISAVAHSLRLPYETVRRRVLRLAAAAACDVGETGVIVPARELATPDHMVALMAVWEEIRGLYYTLRDLGLLDEIVPAADRERWATNAADPPFRAVIRISSDYMLRTVDNVSRQFGGLIAAVVWVTVLRGAGEAPLAAEDPAEALSDLLDDSRRAPVRTSDIARRLDAPHETIRRYVTELCETGQLQRVRGGLIVPARMLAKPSSVKVMRANFADLQRMFAGFARLGVMSAWDRQNPPREAARPSAAAGAA